MELSQLIPRFTEALLTYLSPDKNMSNFTVDGNLFVTGSTGMGTANPQTKLHLYSANNPTELRIQSSAGFGAGRIAFWSDPQGSTNEWRPGYIQSTDQAAGTFTGGLAFFVNGTGFANRTGSIEVMRLVNGNVGIGTPTPQTKLHVYSSANPTVMRIQSSAGFGAGRIEFWSDPQGNTNEWRPGYIQSTDQAPGTFTGGLAFFVNGTGFANKTSAIEVMRLVSGNVGIGTAAPSAKLEVVGQVKATNFTVTSSRQLKDNIAEISSSEAIQTLENLNPVKFSYKADSEKNLHLGFIAEEVPELVATPDRTAINPMDIVAVLTRAVKEQHKTIAALAEKVKMLEYQTA